MREPFSIRPKSWVLTNYPTLTILCSEEEKLSGARALGDMKFRHPQETRWGKVGRRFVEAASPALEPVGAALRGAVAVVHRGPHPERAVPAVVQPAVC